MFLKDKKRKGYSLIEAVVIISILLTVLAGFIKIVMDYRTKLIQKEFSSEVALILKSVDMRISIDGYSYLFWPEETGEYSNTKTFDFIQKALISKNNKICGRSDGWIPQIESEKDRAFIDCNMWKTRIPFNSEIKIKTERVDFGFLGELVLFINFPNNHDKFETMSTMLNHLSKMNIVPQMGMFNFDLVDIETESILQKMECVNNIENCVLRASWSKRGSTENIKVDGTNSMINSNLAFKLNKKDEESIKTCLLWDEKQDGLWESRQVECGVGIYSKNKNEVPVLVQMPVNNVNAQRIFLSKECSQYSVSHIGGQIIKDSEKVPCGIIENDFAGSNQVVMYVDRFSAKEMIVSDNLYSNMIQNVEYINIANDLINNYESSVANLNILNVENETLFNNVVDFMEDVVIGDPELTPKPIEVYLTVDQLETFNLKVREDAELRKLSVSNGLEDGNKNENLIVEPNNGSNEYQNYVKSEYFISTSDANINDECENLNSMIIQKGKGILLTCREDWKDSDKYTWQSNYYGEIGIFNTEECPYGWNEIDDLKSRLMMGSGNFEGENYASGESGGEAFVGITEEELAEHNHMASRLDHLCKDGCSIDVNSNQLVTHAGQSYISKDSGIYSTNVGGDKKHNNLPNYLSVKYCVYAKGDQKTPNLDTPEVREPIWEYHQPLISGWIDDAVTKFYSCVNERREYSPLENKTYSLADCKLDQYRIVKEREKEKYSQEIRFTGNEYMEYRTINETQIWEEIEPVYSEWYNINEPYNCTEEVVIEEEDIYYKIKECKQDQERVKQKMEKDIRFGDERELGSVIYEHQTVDIQPKRKIAAAFFTNGRYGTSVYEKNLGQNYRLPIKIRLAYPFEEKVEYRVQTQDITTESILYRTTPLIYDEFGGLFTAIVDNENGGKLIYDAGFPKFIHRYFQGHGEGVKKYSKNIINWLSKEKSDRGKVLLIVDSTWYDWVVTNSFMEVVNELGYSLEPRIYSVNNYNVDLSLEDMEKFSSIIIVSQAYEYNITIPECIRSGATDSNGYCRGSGKSFFNSQVPNRIVTYVNNGGGLYVIGDHINHDEAANSILKKFGVEFYGSVNRTIGHDAYKMSTIWDRLKNTNYGEGFELWSNMNKEEYLFASGSEGYIREIYQDLDYEAFSLNITFNPGEIEKTIYINILGDNLPEEDEQFKIILSNIDGNGIVLRNEEVIVTIIDNDSAVKSLSNICPPYTYFKNDSCVGKEEFSLEKIEKITSIEQEESYGDLKVRYNENGNRLFNGRIKDVNFDLICDKNNLKLNSPLIISNNPEKSVEVSVEDLSLLDIESWSSFYSFKDGFNPVENNCLNLEKGFDANIKIKANLIKKTKTKEFSCKDGELIDNKCVKNIVESPKKMCLGEYVEKNNECIKK